MIDWESQKEFFLDLCAVFGLEKGHVEFCNSIRSENPDINISDDEIYSIMRKIAFHGNG